MADGTGNGQGSEEAPDIRGRITSINAGDGTQPGILGFVRVEGTLEDDTNYDRAVVTVTANTNVIVRDAGGQRRATFASLEVGQTVEAHFTGPVLQSYPVQATAQQITILK